MVRCKFKCESVTVFEYGAQVVLKPVTSGSKENEEFYKYTPSGELKLSVLTNEAASQFLPGKEFYIDITLVE